MAAQDDPEEWAALQAGPLPRCAACLPDPARAGFVGTEAGAFVHCCAVCGTWGFFGYAVDMERGKPGRWFCHAHRPAA